MFEFGKIPNVDVDESLARFIVSKGEYRPADMTVKPQAFLPYQHVELSVTRQRECADDELRIIAGRVADMRQKTLRGYCEISACECRHLGLDVLPDPIEDWNPNHANIVGYPAQKEEQMVIAQKLARSASSVRVLDD